MSKGRRRELLVKAESFQELVAWAGTVPKPRRNSAGNHDSSAKERFTLARWINGLTLGDVFTEFPLQIWDVEAPAHPDFLVESANITIGIEATEVTDPLVERAQKIAHQRGIEVWCSPKPGSLPQTASDDEIAAHIQDFDGQEPWIGTESDRELVRLVRKGLCDKGKSAEKYPPLQSCVLLLWDDAGTLASREILEDSGALAEISNFRHEFGARFNHVFLMMNGEHFAL